MPKQLNKERNCIQLYQGANYPRARADGWIANKAETRHRSRSDYRMAGWSVDNLPYFGEFSTFHTDTDYRRSDSKYGGKTLKIHESRNRSGLGPPSLPERRSESSSNNNESYWECALVFQKLLEHPGKREL